jgi:hypothetical protein
VKLFLFIIVAMVFAVSARAADVGVSVSVGQPGFYGQIDIGNVPRPQVVYPSPVVISPVPVSVHVPPPIYLHVPPGHAKKWSKHCHKYNACGRPVYFVQDRWYNEVYVPEYQARHRHEDGGHGDYHGGGRDDHGDRDGHGHGRGRGGR